MTMARSKLVDPELTRVYHCVSRCVRKAFLIRSEDGAEVDHSRWLEDRLRELSGTFGISVISYAVMSNHLHVLVRLDPERARAWSGEEVAGRWARLYPPKDARRRPIEVTSEWLAGQAADVEWIERMRGRLRSLSWFMKLLKEPLARMANELAGVRGHFFEGRFRSVALLDDAAVLAVAAYVDLNPLAANLAETPESSEHASIKERIDHVASVGLAADLAASQRGDAAAIERLGRAEESHWLCPIDDRRRHGASREGLFEGVPMSSYLLLVDHAGKVERPGKASLSSSFADIFTRLNVDPSRLTGLVETLKLGRSFGHVLATTRAHLRNAARYLSRRHLVNLTVRADSTPPSPASRPARHNQADSSIELSWMDQAMPAEPFAP